MKKYFGTDGIRGKYRIQLTDEIAYYCGNCLGKKAKGGTIVIGRDTRLSGTALFYDLSKGICDAGSNVIDLGVISTPAVSYITEQYDAKFGIVISASHNPKEYNGIKIFNHEGRKLMDDEEVSIENHIENKKPYLVENRGCIKQNVKYIEKYFELLKETANFDLSGIKVCIDCANGAVSKFAGKIFKELNAEVLSFYDSGDGALINEGCGALFPDVVASKVVEHKADCGFCFDGDADRIIAVDKNGKIVDGDSIIYMIGCHLKNNDKLNGNCVVGTYHTNMGVENSLREKGINLFRTNIGDHYVMEKMLEEDLLVGGEQSGHIILREFINTGDGLLTAVYLTRLMKEYKAGFETLDDSVHFPQVNVNIVSEFKEQIMSDKNLLNYKLELEKELGETGRILLRASGTEPKVRIMVECDSEEKGDKIANLLKNRIDSIIESLI